MCLRRTGWREIIERFIVEFHFYVVIACELPEVETKSQLGSIARLHILTHLKLDADGSFLLELQFAYVFEAGVTAEPVHAEYLVFASHICGISDLSPYVFFGEKGVEGVDSVRASVEKVRRCSTPCRHSSSPRIERHRIRRLVPTLRLSAVQITQPRLICAVFFRP